MPLHERVFYGILFFLAGVLGASFLAKFAAGTFILCALASILALCFLLFGSRTRALLSVFVFLGYGYYAAYTALSDTATLIFDREIEAIGMVENVRQTFERQELTIAFLDPYQGSILATVPRYPAFTYGTKVAFTGTILTPEPQRKGRLLKDGISGTSRFPTLVAVSVDGGSAFVKALIAVKAYAMGTFRRYLSPDEAALMAGLTLGDTSDFSKGLREKFIATGTSHIVALSGFNVTVIGTSAIAMFSWVFSRRVAILAAGFVIVAFVAMTGAEASVVRAAIMASLVWLARESGRTYSVRNALAATALLMVLVNPRILAFDLGFQLSFLALLGIVYLEPTLRKLSRASPEPGFLGWRKNIFATLAAELSVVPFVAITFGTFSWIGVLTNVLILTLIPLTMLLGFFLVLSAAFAAPLAGFLALLAHTLLGYELWVIESVRTFVEPLTLSFYPLFVLLYYLCIAILVAWVRSHAPAYDRR
jgi:competence protein ComEC